MAKTKTMKIRLSSEEKQTFERAAALSGIAVSAWMRDRLRRAARRELQDASQPVPFLMDVAHG